MPRRSSARSAPRPAPRAAPVRNPPQTARQAPPPAPAQQSGGGSMFGGLGSTLAQGLAFGTGSAVAHRAVDAVVGPRAFHHDVQEAAVQEAAASAPVASMMNTDSCTIHSKAFMDCVDHHGSDVSKCQFYLDMLNECRRGAGATA